MRASEGVRMPKGRPREVFSQGPSHRRHRNPSGKPEPMADIKPLPKQRNKEQRAAYLARPSVQRWLQRNGSDLKRVVDIRHVYQELSGQHIEFAEILYVRKVDGVKEIKRRIISGDPPPIDKRLNGR